MIIFRELLHRLRAALQQIQQEEKLGVGDQMLVVLKKEPEEKVQKEDLQ